MDIITDIFTNMVFLSAVISWFIAQLIKVIYTLIKDKKLDFARMFGSGGMPSSHSALTASMATAVGLEAGFNSVEFAIATILTFIVMHDATGVRRSAGEQAKILNKIVEEFGKEKLSDTGKKLKELLGHTPKQVFFGALLGIFIAIILYI